VLDEMIFDIHAHGIFDDEKDFFSLNEILRLMEDNGIGLTGLTLDTSSPNLKKSVIKELAVGFKKDPYKSHNVYMLNAIREKGLEDKIFPFLYLPPIKRLAIDSIAFYEERFGNRQFGYKIHNQELKVDLNEMVGLKSKRPLIIHSSVDNCSSPDKMLKFAKVYGGNVNIAHFGKFNNNLLREVRNQDNLFIDSSVGILMFNALKSGSTRVHRCRRLKRAKNLKHLYELVARDVTSEKLLFATDYPFCETVGKGYSYELKVLRSLESELFSLVAYKNARRFLNLK
jgi:hypothetical protein